MRVKLLFVSLNVALSNCELPLTTTTLRTSGDRRRAASSVFAASNAIQDPVKREVSLGFPACTCVLPQNTIGTSGRNVSEKCSRNKIGAGPSSTHLPSARMRPSHDVTLVRPDGYIAYSAHGRHGMAELTSVRSLLERQTHREQI